MTPSAQALQPLEPTREQAAVVRRGVGVNYSEVKKAHEQVVKVLPGGYFVGHGGHRIETSLGSCVAACIRDPSAGVGGVNHFMLPHSDTVHDQWLSCDRTRYGVHAMETLINEIIKRGGQRQRFEVKLFGGGHVVSAMQCDIGRLNIAFARHFLKTEGFSVASEDLGGDCCRRLIYDVTSGDVFIKRTVRGADQLLHQRDRVYRERISRAPMVGDIELFDE